MAENTPKAIHQRRTRFVKEYILDHNATRAAIAAGYSEKTAGSQGARLLKDADVAKSVLVAENKANAKYELTAERIKQEIARLCYYDPAAYFNPDGSAKPISEIDEDSRRAIAGFETAELFSGNGEERGLAGYIKKFKLPDKAKALELAAKINKMLVDRVEVTAGDELIRRLVAGRKRASQAA
jgi:phage terminase small subunit